MDVEALRVIADNPSTIDLLGLSPIAAAVGDVVSSDNSEPVTVGLHGPWGSGKSSLLRQVLADLEARERTVVIELNPWEFDDQDDVKGTIIASVLSTLAEGGGRRTQDQVQVESDVEGKDFRPKLWARLRLHGPKSRCARSRAP